MPRAAFGCATSRHYSSNYKLYPEAVEYSLAVGVPLYTAAAVVVVVVVVARTCSCSTMGIMFSWVCGRASEKLGEFGDELDELQRKKGTIFGPPAQSRAAEYIYF